MTTLYILEIIKKYYKQILLVLLVLLTFHLLNVISNNKEDISDLNSEISLRVQRYKESRNENGELIIRQNVIEAYNKRIVDSLIGKIDFGKNKIKKPLIVIQETTTVSVDTLYVSYTDTLFSVVLGEAPFKDSTKYYHISGVAKPKGIQFNVISFPMKNTYIVSKQRYNLFYNRPVVTIHHDNPYVSTEKVNSVILKEKEPNKFVKISTKVGLLALGYYLGKKY